MWCQPFENEVVPLGLPGAMALPLVQELREEEEEEEEGGGRRRRKRKRKRKRKRR